MMKLPWTTLCAIRLGNTMNAMGSMQEVSLKILTMTAMFGGKTVRTVGLIALLKVWFATVLTMNRRKNMWTSPEMMSIVWKNKAPRMKNTQKKRTKMLP